MAATETDLGDSLDSLRYLVAVPGGFAAAYPDATDDMLVSILMDGFAEAQLYGLFPAYTMDDDGIVTPALTRAEIALAVLLAGIRMISVTLANNFASVTYKAGSAEYSTTSSAGLQRDVLAALVAQRKAIIAALLNGQTASAFLMADQYMVRVYSEHLMFAEQHPLVLGW